MPGPWRLWNPSRFLRTSWNSEDFSVWLNTSGTSSPTSLLSVSLSTHCVRNPDGSRRNGLSQVEALDLRSTSQAFTSGYYQTLRLRYGCQWDGSWELTETEMKWAIYEQEAFTIVWSIIHFSPYLRDKPFMVRTDHQSLHWLWNTGLFISKTSTSRFFIERETNKPASI